MPDEPSESLPPPSPTERPLWNWLAFLLIVGVGARFVPVPTAGLAIAGGIVLTALYVAAMIGIALGVARLQLGALRLVILLVLALAWWAAGRFYAIDRVIEPFNAHAAEIGGQPTMAQLVIAGIVRNLTSLSLILAATFGGALVAQLIKARNMLGPICGMIALIDIWGVLFGGIVSQLLTNPVTAQASQKAFAETPKLGVSAGPDSYAVPLPDIGAGDYLFLGMLLAALVRLGMNWQGATRLVWPLVTLALLSIPMASAFFDLDIMLPGLLFIGLGVALPNLRFFKFTREEKFALLYAGVFVVILTGGLYFALMAQIATGRYPGE